MQKPGECITYCETLIRTIARKTKYAEKSDPGQELMRDRLCTGVHNADLREVLLHHYKEDGKTPYTIEEQLATAKSWEAAHNTSESLKQTTTEEQVNFATRDLTKSASQTKKNQKRCG